MPAQGNAPVIVRRKKVIAGEGHHGGAWKVAISGSCVVARRAMVEGTALRAERRSDWCGTGRGHRATRLPGAGRPWRGFPNVS
jgi:hypothetical protein